MAVSSKPRFRALINATYELQELVSSQREHEVFLARDLRDGSAVLVKRLRPELAQQRGELARFTARAQMLERLEHESLPRVCVDVDESGAAFMVQELVEGRPISDLIGAFPQGVPVPLIASVLLPLIEGLALAHSAGVCHGALDPSQVLLLGPLHDPSAKLVNLDGGSDALKQDPSYRAPEATAATPAADVYACGVLLYHMLSGVLPFQSGKRSAVPLHELAPQVSSAFVQLTAACLREQPERRPTDAGALLEHLRACCELAPQQRATPSPRAQAAHASAHPKHPSAPAQRRSAQPLQPSANTRASDQPQRASANARGSDQPQRASANAHRSDQPQRAGANAHHSDQPQRASANARGSDQPQRASAHGHRSVQPQRASAHTGGAEPQRGSAPAQRAGHAEDGAQQNAMPWRRVQATTLDEGGLEPETLPPPPSRPAVAPVPRGSLSPEQAAELLSAKLDARRRAGSDPADKASAPPASRSSQPTAARPGSDPAGRASAPPRPHPSRPTVAQRGAAHAEDPSEAPTARSPLPRAARASAEAANRASAPASTHPSQPAAARRSAAPANADAVAARSSQPSATRRGSDPATDASATAVTRASQPSATRRSSDPATDTSATAATRSSQPSAARRSSDPADAAAATVATRSSQPSVARRSSDPETSGSSAAPTRSSLPAAARRSPDPAARASASPTARQSQPSARRRSDPADGATASASALSSPPSAAVASAEPAESATNPPATRSSQPTAAGGSLRPGASRPPSRKPPIKLTQAQIDALAALRHSYDEKDDRDRWLAVLWVLLLLLLWLVGAPYYFDTGLSKAHATFGPKLRVAATAFSVASVVVAMHPLIAQAGRHWIIQRLRGAVMQTTSGCFVLVTSSLYSTAPFVAAAADFGQRWLPWCISFALLLLMLEYFLRGARHLAHDARYAALVFALALLGSFGTYRALLQGLAQEKQLLAKSKQATPPAPAALNDPAYAQTIQAVTQEPEPSEAADRGIDSQRTALGADEAQDLQPAQAIERSHKRDGAAIERLQKKLPAANATTLAN